MKLFVLDFYIIFDVVAKILCVLRTLQHAKKGLSNSVLLIPIKGGEYCLIIQSLLKFTGNKQHKIIQGIHWKT